MTTARGESCFHQKLESYFVHAKLPSLYFMCKLVRVIGPCQPRKRRLADKIREAVTHYPHLPEQTTCLRCTARAPLRRRPEPNPLAVTPEANEKRQAGERTHPHISTPT